MEGKRGTSEIENPVVAQNGDEAELETPEIEPEPLPTGMTEEQIEEVTRLLRAGRRLPPHLFPHLFEVPREYELSYRGKARRVDVLADTMAMPIQAVRTFGEPKDGWSNMLILGDNLQVLRHLINMKAAGYLSNPDGSVGVRLCYIDPPFASEQEFVGSRNEKAYSDRVAGAEFVEHLRRRLILIHELLTDDGSLVVHLDTRKAHYIKVILDEIFGEGNFRNEIIWKRTSAHSEAEPASGGRRQHGSSQPDRRGESALAGWERRHDDQDASSNWRSPPRPAAKEAEPGTPYNHYTWEGGGRREGGGGARGSVEGG